MRIFKCCIDVGLKNLAICITSSDSLDYQSTKLRGKKRVDTVETQPRPEPEILHWTVDDILSDTKNSCQGNLKSGKACQRNASFVSKDSFYCKTHLETSSKFKKIKQKRVKDYTLQEIALFIIEYCNTLFQSDTFQTLKQQENNQVKVFIELQPNCARKMMFVSNVLFTKFTEFLPGKYIRFVRASQKLNIVYNGPELICDFKGYKRRKWLAIEYTKWFLKQFKASEHWLAYLNTIKKQDDMCDTFLMCLNK